MILPWKQKDTPSLRKMKNETTEKDRGRQKDSRRLPIIMNKMYHSYSKIKVTGVKRAKYEHNESARYTI